MKKLKPRKFEATDQLLLIARLLLIIASVGLTKRFYAAQPTVFGQKPLNTKRLPMSTRKKANLPVERKGSNREIGLLHRY